MRKTSFPADICWSNVLYYLKFIVKKFLGFKKANKKIFFQKKVFFSLF